MLNATFLSLPPAGIDVSLSTGSGCNSRRRAGLLARYSPGTVISRVTALPHARTPQQQGVGAEGNTDEMWLGQGTDLSLRASPRLATLVHPYATCRLQQGGRWAHVVPRTGAGVLAGGGGRHRSWDSPHHTCRPLPRLQRTGEADELLITGAAWLVQHVSAARLAEPCGG